MSCALHSKCESEEKKVQRKGSVVPEIASWMVLGVCARRVRGGGGGEARMRYVTVV